MDLFLNTKRELMATITSPSPEPQKALEVVPAKPSRQKPLAFVFFLIVSFITIALDRPPRPLPKEAPATDFSAERAMVHVAAIARAPHPLGSEEHGAVRDYIVRELQGLGLTPQIEKTTDSDTDITLENIICRLKGAGPEKAVLMVAHYDSVGAGPGASDDGVAVAAFLEAARALKSSPQLKRDIIFLFTDGEEKGLRGARAFVSDPSWAKDVGLVLNFDARGNGGPSIMFETSDKNGWLISNFGQGASHPTANSLSYEIYKHMPNNTDFTVFRRAGYPGLNFAFIEGPEYYHTSRDSISNVTPGTLQHHGDYVLQMAKQFGNTISEIPRTANLVYFDVLGIFLVRYSQAMATVFLGIAAILTGLILYLGLRTQSLRAGACILAFFSMLAGVIITTVGAWLVSLVALQMRHIPRINAGLKFHTAWYILAASAVGLAGGVAFYTLISKKLGTTSLMMGAFLGWLSVTILISLYFPGGTYLFLWPLLFSLAGAVIVFARRSIAPNIKSLIMVLSGIPAIVLLVPMIHKIYWAFAAQSGTFVGALLGLLLSLLVGPVAVEQRSKRWVLPASLAIAGAGLFITAIAVSVF
jgi:peptidase M28-like protein